MSKLKERFQEEITKKLQEKLKIKNYLAVPRLEKVVINVGVGSKSRENPKFTEKVSENLKAITGQSPKTTKARKAISGFKVRMNQEVGLMVTIRGQRMADFIYKLANIDLPRMRDFRGLKEEGFDKLGNYTFAVTDQLIFPEITPEKSDILHGLSISLKTTAKSIDEGRALLEIMGFPFKK